MKIRSISKQYTEIDGITVELSFQPSWIMNGHEDPVVERDGNILVVGYLVNDQDVNNPLDDSDGMGMIYSAHRHSRTHSDMQTALALGGDWSPNLSLVDATAGAVLLRELMQGRFQADLVDFIMECANNGRHRESAISMLVDDFTDEYYESWLSTKIKNSWMSWQALREEQWRIAVAAGTIGNPYVVTLDCYEHGGQVWSVTGCGTQCAFDTAPGVGVWVPDDGLTEDLNALRVTSGLDASRAKAQEYARQCLHVYNAWLAGDCYGVATDVFEIDAQGNAKRIGNDSVWGYIGAEHARSSMKDYAACRAAQAIMRRDIRAAA